MGVVSGNMAQKPRWGGLPPRPESPETPAEAVEFLLHEFNEAIKRMDRPTLEAFRARCATMNVGTPEHDTILEVIDGQLALRDLADEGT